MSDRITELTSRQFWDERHVRLDLKYTVPQTKKYYLDFELDRVFRSWLNVRSGQKILEIGCGSSLWLPYFSRQFGMIVAGLDYSDTGLAKCQELLRLNRIQGSLQKADFRNGPGPDRGAYDVVFSLGLIEHFEHPEKVLGIFREYLRPDGLLITWIPNTAGMIAGMSSRFNRNFRGFYSRIDLRSLKAFHTEQGFKILQSSYLQFLDLNFLSLAFLPGLAQKFFSLAFRGLGLGLIALEKALSRSVQSSRLCAGIVVVARRKD